ncbi:hypothetical protein Q9299_11215 [Gemmobacter fulvus]|uniref:hypothetical protein n=1 Tax=Gemmobacter fulvus TaxID=2840474 RepID=UPI00279676D4|nr:hypothetical protein [Gemmobacter fulvus]MDQ1848857.1 hypothetical protein [Gemmobacter fulvus]
MIRPEALAALARWREAMVAAGVALVGLWLMALGGWLLIPLGAALLALAAALAVIALRRLRFVQRAAAPGVVDLDEGQISYFGPVSGGFVSLRELVELRLLARGGQRFWRLKQADGQALLVPVDAAGANGLFDAFAALPGMDMQGLLQALDPPVTPGAAGLPAVPQDTLGPVIWRRAVQPALT